MDMNATQMKTALKCVILTNERVKGVINRLTVKSERLAEAEPGQFAMIKCGAGAYLRRPFSICDIDAGTSAVTFLYRITGAGTNLLSFRKAGETLDVVGPLGRGYDITPGAIAVVGGGIGVFPLLLLSKRLNGIGVKPDVFVGYREAESVVLDDELKSAARDFILVSDDGSAGGKGFVTDAFAKAAGYAGKYDMVYACGPVPMLKELRDICGARGIKAQFSLEQRMGCGIGACLSCVCALKSDKDNYGYSYARVCKDGPVFAADSVAFENF